MITCQHEGCILPAVMPLGLVRDHVTVEAVVMLCQVHRPTTRDANIYPKGTKS